MDVRRGHCWRCEQAIEGNPVHCKLCWIAVYCSQVCCVSDVFRHSVPECETWGPKVCNNSECDAVGPARTFIECSQCMCVWYCGKECQNQDWECHRDSCREQVAINVETVAHLRNEYLIKGQAMNQPYYIGNAIAIDMLNLEENECSTKTERPIGHHPALEKDYSILSVGCGNLRNYIHTIVSLPKGFQGRLHTTLNDFDPFVQARNILFLYMMIAFADKGDIAAIVTTIWYSLHLSEAHFKFLTSCLKTLTNITRATLVDALGNIVDVSDADLDLIRQVWQNWLQLECYRNHPNYINLQKQRAQMATKESLVAHAVYEYRQELEGEYAESFDEWCKNGIFLPNVTARNRYLEYGNPTLTGFKFIDGIEDTEWERRSVLICPNLVEFVYCIPPDLNPFGEWDHLLVQKFSGNNSLIDMYYTYIEDQIKQTVVRLQTTRQRISFLVKECMDMGEYTLPVLPVSKFDRIFTSNIADYVGTQKLLSLFKAVLNEENMFAVIVTQIWNWYMIIPDSQISYSFKLCDRTIDGTLTKTGIRALFDTGVTDTPLKIKYQEYFNSITYFMNYLRASYIACKPPEEATIARFHDVMEFEGLRMRDFRRELNKVVPFQYRINIRKINMLRGSMSHMMEWYIP